MNKLYYILFILVVFSCKNEEEKKSTVEENTKEISSKEAYATITSLPATEWLVGNWKDLSGNPKGQSHEIWWINADGHLEGKEFFVKPSLDTSKIAFNKIVPHLGGFQFVNITKETSKTEFRLKTFGADSLLFENSTHSYPQKITYKKITSDSLTITLDGYIFESQRTLVFKMKRF